MQNSKSSFQEFFLTPELSCFEDFKKKNLDEWILLRQIYDLLYGIPEDFKGIRYDQKITVFLGFLMDIANLLRSTQTLVLIGYPHQAATLHASIWEAAHLVASFSRDSTLIEKYVSQARCLLKTFKTWKEKDIDHYEKFEKYSSLSIEKFANLDEENQQKELKKLIAQIRDFLKKHPSKLNNPFDPITHFNHSSGVPKIINQSWKEISDKNENHFKEKFDLTFKKGEYETYKELCNIKHHNSSVIGKIKTTPGKVEILRGPRNLDDCRYSSVLKLAHEPLLALLAFKSKAPADLQERIDQLISDYKKKNI